MSKNFALTFAERLALEVELSPARESFPTGKPAPVDAFAHVAGRGFTAAQPRRVFK